MRDRMRHVRGTEGADERGAGVGHWGVAALAYTRSHTEQLF